MIFRCQYCGRELPTKDFALPGHRPMPIPLPCDCPQAKAEQEREAREQEQERRREAFSVAWVRAGIPQRFAHVDADFERAAPLFGGRSLYVCGKNGRGKTHVACQVAKAYLVRNTHSDGVATRCWKCAQFVTSQEMFSRLKNSWDRWDVNEEDVFSRWAGVDLLVLDDLGKGVPSEWAAENIFRIVDARWSNKRPMVITSQYDMADLSNRYAKAGAETMLALLSRLAGWCDVVRMGGDDRRVS